uniref:Uncharacterized protein n=1 Tax=Arundo donax TaxID=35708 RepID=A0A0A8XRM8_ARUDO
MTALVPLGGARARPRHRRGISATSDSREWMKCCITVAKGRPFGDKTSTKRKRSVRTPELSEEIVIEILVWLPVKSLLKFKSVCKAWRAIITDPIFIREHLRCSASKFEQDPSFIISPHTLDYVIPGERWPSTFCNHIRFYQWQQGASAAKFMQAKDFRDVFNMVLYFAHCDGLVLAPTDRSLYVFNPATRDAITLPDSNHNKRQQGGASCCYCAGLGLDPRTGEYKVVQAFYRSMDPDTNIYRMGMEVFTITGDGGGIWREIMDDPPYPVESWQTGLTIKGFLFWHIDKARHKQQTPRGLLRLSLADETFGVTGLPDSMDPALDDAFALDVLHGELCVTAPTSDIALTIWTLPIQEDGQGQCWEQRCKIYVTNLCHPMAFLPGGQIILWKSSALYRYDLATSELTVVCELDRMRYQGRRARTTWKNLFTFNVKPYTESLVRITI